MKNTGPPKPYRLHSLLDLIDQDTLSYIITGYCRRIKMGYVALSCYDKIGRLIFLEPQAIEQADLDEQFGSELCRIFRETDEAREACAQCNHRQSEMYFGKAKYSFINDINLLTFRCTPLGITHIIAPIIVQDKLMGVLSVGQRLIVSDKKQTSMNLEKNERDGWMRLISGRQRPNVDNKKK